MTSKSEIWKNHPDIPGVQVSTLGRVRTLDRTVPRKNGTYPVKGRILKPASNSRGYMQVSVKVDGKWATKRINRLVAQTFIDNPDNLTQVNHKNCNRSDNRVSNLEWCTAKYNSQYREKYGISNTELKGQPVFAVNLTTLEVLHFRSQGEASRKLGINRPDINYVIKGKYKQTGGFWFKADDGNGIEIDKDKLNDIVDNMRFRGGVFAINLNTLEVSRFNSQMEASRKLGVSRQGIYKVIKGRYKQTGGFWFVNDDGHAVDVVKSKLHDIGGVGLKIK